MNKYLIYALIDPRTDQIRYVGKSTSGLARPKSHTKPSLLKAKSHKSHWLKELTSLGLKPNIEILEVAESPDNLDKREVFWIAKCRAQGLPLTNGTAGGEGALGRVNSNDTKEKMRQARLDYYKDPSKHIPAVNKKEYKVVDGVSYKHCGFCKEYKCLTEFGKYKARWDGLHSRCKICHATYVQKQRGQKAPSEN